MAESKEELKSLLMKVKEESEKAKMKIMASSPITSWQTGGKTLENSETSFSWAQKSLQMVTTAMKLKMLAPWNKNYDQPRQHMKKQRHHFANKGLSS